VSRYPTPTRHNLLELRERRRQMERGRDVLARRRDGLLLLLQSLLERRREVRAELGRARLAAEHARVLAFEQHSGIELRELAETRSVPATVAFAETKLAGLTVPMVLAPRMELELDERGYGLVGTDAYVDLLAETHERLLSVAVRAADVEAVCHVVVDELTRRVRQVNGLNHRVLPDLEADIAYVDAHLRERDREEHVRQLFLKRKRHEQPRPRPRRRLRRAHRSGGETMETTEATKADDPDEPGADADGPGASETDADVPDATERDG
jgi:V/A-type H+-transporting ATPase subunit D